jgi:hypothetical protein
MRRLSSAMPHLLLLMSLIFGAMVAVVVVVTAVWGDTPWTVPTAFAAFGAVVVLASVLNVRSMCDVWLDGDDLVVKRGRVTERIPMKNVTSVSEDGMGGHKYVRVHVKRSTAFGESFKFSAESGGSSVGKCEAARILRQRVRRAIGRIGD